MIRDLSLTEMLWSRYKEAAARPPSPSLSEFNFNSKGQEDKTQ